MPQYLLRAISAAALALAVVTLPAAAGYEVPPDASLSGSYLAGRSASKLRDNDIASGYFARALRDDPGNPVLVERLFLLELSEGNIDIAEDYAERVLSFNSQQRMARIILGLRDCRLGRYEAARKHFAEASYTPVGELTSALLTAWSYAGEGELNPALKALDKLDANESFANFKAFHAALIADHLGNAIRAEAFYEKANEQSPASLRIVQAYGNFLARSGRIGEARKLYDGFLEGGERNPLIAEARAGLAAGKRVAPFIATPSAGVGEALFSLASAMTDDQSIDVALLYAQLALSFNADRPVALTLLGDIYEDTQRPLKAIDVYEQMPDASVLRNNADIEIAVNLQRLDRKDDAQARLDAVIARDPGNYEALVTLGNIHRNNEEYAKAAAAYDRAIALVGSFERDHWRVFYYSGISWERQKIWDKAEAQFRRALELSPDEPLVLNYLGYSMIEKKIGLQEALAMVKKAVELRPNDGYIVDSLGWAHYQLGDYEEAVSHLERAVELNPADPIIGEHLGDVYWRVGRRLEARFQWQHAKDNRPEPDDLKRIEGKLKNGMPTEAPVTPAETKSGQNNG
ncbi:MAG: tetratricopeptide repeat protein [Hyphomicrobiales bacterium]